MKEQKYAHHINITIAALYLLIHPSAFAADADKSTLVSSRQEEAVILTPKPGPAPRINGPKIYGARPGHPFLYRIPAQGERPMIFSAKHLPKGLHLDASTGIITGTTPARGEYQVIFQAKNKHGNDSRVFKLVSGDTLSLTPSMGWNDWYAFYRRITEQDMREAADIIATNGMADVGYQYVNVDDCWMNRAESKDPLQVGPFRDEQGNLLPNKHFPDMKALADYIHSKGLKAGLYTSPGCKTCCQFAGSYQHEAQDARQFADWGFDFLKYDWCSYRDIAGGSPTPAELKKNYQLVNIRYDNGRTAQVTLAELKKPYQLMGGLLKQQKRDILFNLSQHGYGNVWKWGAEVGGQSWRTSRDLGLDLSRIFQVALTNAEHGAWQKPGAWNDPDYIQIGYIGKARDGSFKPCPFTPTEQYSFMSLWCLMSAPLFYSGDLTKLDAFTLNVLCNPEVIDIDQDPLGQCARVIPLGDKKFLMIKNLEDGGHALGLCNAGESPADLTANWFALGLVSGQRVRDLWRQKNLGVFDDAFSAKVPRHGVVLVRLAAVPKATRPQP